MIPLMIPMMLSNSVFASQPNGADRHRIEPVPAHGTGGHDGPHFGRRRAVVADRLGGGAAGAHGVAHPAGGGRHVPGAGAALGTGFNVRMYFESVGGERVETIEP